MMYRENVESVEKKKRRQQNLESIRKYNFAITNLTAHANSLPAYYHYTPKFPNAVIKIIKWSKSKADIVVQHI